MSMDTKSSAAAGQVHRAEGAPGLDADLLRLLRCPLTRSPLRLEGEHLVATVGGLRYPIRDGIPVMLVEEAVLPEGVTSLEELKAKLGR